MIPPPVAVNTNVFVPWETVNSLTEEVVDASSVIQFHAKIGFCVSSAFGTVAGPFPPPVLHGRRYSPVDAPPLIAVSQLRTSATALPPGVQRPNPVVAAGLVSAVT